MIDSTQTNAQFNAVIFENRNQTYGAFELRNIFNKNQATALFISSFLLFLSILGLHFYLQYYDNQDMLYEEIDFRSIEYATEVVILPNVVPDFVPPKGVEKPVVVDAMPVVVEDSNPIEKTKADKKSDDQKTENADKIGKENGEDNNKQTDIAQTSVSNDTTGNAMYTNEIFMKVDIGAEFVGGKERFATFLRENIKYPDYAIQNKVSGVVFVHLVINLDGSLQDLRLYKGIEQSCNEEVMRVMKLMPNWIPARKNGYNVRQRLIIPVSFDALK